MGYAERVLQPGETIVYRARLHWIIYFSAIVSLLVAAGLGIGAAVTRHDQTIMVALAVVAAIALLVGLWQLAGAWVRASSTEIVVTTRRIIYKTGFVTRNTVEMNLDKVESVLVRQGVIGRMLDYGTVIIRGVGAGLEPVANIAAPLALHRHVSAPATA
jgi:uncharacterized membrane protein YdbT with pleckstrin-like domain